jgi:hypothetical protein
VNIAGAVLLVASIRWRDRQYLTIATTAAGWMATLEMLDESQREAAADDDTVAAEGAG